MARDDNESPIEMSLLDRLLDDEPASTRDPPRTRYQALEGFRDALRRDLEALLNTRACNVTWSAALWELDTSILNYGVLTVTSAELSTEDNRERLRSAVERAIRRFEPRFLRVNVTLVDDPERIDRTLRFRIEALAQAKPAPEPLIFDSVLDPSTQGMTVSPPRDV
jgi:type VI secretion system protein ImpF